MTRPTLSFYFINRTIFGDEYVLLSSSICSSLHSPVTQPLLDTNILPSPYSQTPSTYVPSSRCEIKFHNNFLENNTEETLCICS